MKYEVFWKNPRYKPRPALKGDIECDYLIVGGGISGVSTAYFLNKLGAKNTVLIEKNFIGSGATGKAAGTLVMRGETDLIDLYKTHPKKEAELYWKGIRQGLEGLKKVIRDEKIDCDAEPQDTLYCGFKHKTYVDLRNEYKLEKKLEKSTKFLEKDELKKELNTEYFDHGFLSSLHGLSVNPLKLVQNLSRTLEKHGIKIYENTTFLSADNNTVKTEKGTIKYKKLIFAVDADDPDEQVTTQKTSLVITRPLSESELEKTGLNRKKIVWDSRKSYHYFKVLPDRRMMFGYGFNLVHKKHRRTDPHPRHINSIKNFIKNLFPYLDLKIEYAWAGTFGVTKFYEPLFRFEKNTASISGAGSQLICFMGANYIAHKLLGKKSSVEKFFKK